MTELILTNKHCRNIWGMPALYLGVDRFTVQVSYSTLFTVCLLSACHPHLTYIIPIKKLKDCKSDAVEGSLMCHHMSGGQLQMSEISNKWEGYELEQLQPRRFLPAEETGSGSSSDIDSRHWWGSTKPHCINCLYTTCILSAEYALGIPTVCTLDTTWVWDSRY